MDINAIASALIKALRDSTQSNLNVLDMNRRNFGEDVMNRGAARGTLYSTAGAAQKTRYDGTEYLPKYTQMKAQGQQQELTVNSQIIDAKNKIDAMNRAAAELNKIDDNYFNSLMV